MEASIEYPREELKRSIGQIKSGKLIGEFICAASHAGEKKMMKICDMITDEKKD